MDAKTNGADKVDVLAVLDAAAMGAYQCGHMTGDRHFPGVREYEQARAAVAELIESDKEYDAAVEAASGFIEDGYEYDSYGVYGSEFYRCLACEAESGAGVLNEGVQHHPGCVRHRYEQAIERRVAALARVEAKP